MVVWVLLGVLMIVSVLLILFYVSYIGSAIFVYKYGMRRRL